MEKNGTGILEQYTGSLSHRIEQEYHIGEELYRGDIKRGLRNSDGTGVPIGVTRVGSVLGYMIEDGVRIPVPGQLYYRGCIERSDRSQLQRSGCWLSTTDEETVEQGVGCRAALGDNYGSGAQNPSARNNG